VRYSFLNFKKNKFLNVSNAKNWFIFCFDIFDLYIVFEYYYNVMLLAFNLTWMYMYDFFFVLI